MSYSRRSRYYESPSPYGRHSRSVSRSPSRSRSRSCDSSDAENPGNNLYVTGLPSRVTKRDIEKHFSTEGKVENVHLVIDPRTRESRGFGFVTMSTLEEADRCIKYLDRTVFEGRVITVEKAKRGRGRTPTPGRYLGLKTVRGGGRRSPSYSPYSRSRSPSRGRSRSRSRSYSPYYGRRRRSYSPAYSRRCRRSSYPPDERCYSRRRSPSYDSRSPLRRRRERSYDYSPSDRYYRRSYNRDYSPDTRYRSLWDYSPDDHYYGRGRSRYNTDRSISPRHRGRRTSYSPSGSYYSRSMSPRSCYSESVSPSPRGRSRSRRNKYDGKRSVSRCCSKGSYESRDSRSSRRHTRSPSATSSSSTRAVTPTKSSP
ncbi:hypothetical protein ACP275_14G075200 [Erythranthe tilingii]